MKFTPLDKPGHNTVGTVRHPDGKLAHVARDCDGCGKPQGAIYGAYGKWWCGPCYLEQLD